MKKILLSAAIIAASFTTYAQVGVGTTDPKATLDVVGDAATATSLDGIIAPRISGDDLGTKTYGPAQLGAIVYVTVLATTPAGQTVNVTSNGYYFFDSLVWQKIGNTKFVNGTITTDAVFNTGNVGIGVVSPTAKLHLSGGEAATSYTAATIALGYAGDGSYQHYIHTRHDSALPGNAIDFYTSDGTIVSNFATSVHAMTINNGKVGIGTTTPGATLEVAGTIKIGDSNDLVPTVGMIRFNTSNSIFEGYTDDLNGDGTTGDNGWVALH